MTADVRFHPDTLVVENVDGQSQFGLSFDDFGRRFICMNRLPVQHVVLSSKWLARNPRLAFSETVQDCNERSVRPDCKGGGDGVQLFPISANHHDRRLACRLVQRGVRHPHLARRRAAGDRYDGCAFSCDPTGNLIHVDRLEPRGATFAAMPLLAGREFLASRDDWFRPVFLARGPDGALYVADMYRKVIEHPDYLPEEVRKQTDFETGKTQGRIWRVTREGSAPPGASPRRKPWRFPRRHVDRSAWRRETVRRLLLENALAGGPPTRGACVGNSSRQIRIGSACGISGHRCRMANS